MRYCSRIRSTVLLAEADKILTWANRHPSTLNELQSNYTSLVARTLGIQLAQLNRKDPTLAARLLTCLAGCGPDSLSRVVLAPETCSRLRWRHGGSCDDRDLWQFLLDVLNIEQVRNSGAAAQSSFSRPAVWSALGDLGIDAADVPVVCQGRRSGLLIDSESPVAICLHKDTFGPEIKLGHYADVGARKEAQDRLEAAMRLLSGADPTIAEFVLRFTLVANVVVDGTAHFSSGSTGEYVGRSIFCNAHLASVSPELLAESLVHEAIHSFLYMHEACDSWIVGDEGRVFDSVESPWTGRILPIRTYLQACFVWFGVLNFWMRQRIESAFDIERSNRRLDAARRGFQQGSLVEKMSASLPWIPSRLVDLVAAMQQTVVSELS